ncbi:type I polyketide synthase [Amycolatopsis nigrescens]|uniref:type I polyketide synthase n=1 Tax=Amycolatopsis nigrescens TaxID=381445 RepID=UPI00035D7918|nr:type I polyketide synthase [Amycolatopsis nigrescens]
MSAPEQDAAELRSWLVRRVAGLLGVPEREVDPARPLQESGLSSRDAMGLTGELGGLLGRALPATLVWQHPTIGALVAALSEQPGAHSVHSGHGGHGRHSGQSGPALRPPDAEPGEPVAVVGIGCRLPGEVDSPSAFWRLLADGDDGIGTVPDGRWESFAPAADLAGLPVHGGFLADATGFDAEFFGITPREAAAMDPQQRMLLEVSWAALEHAGIPPGSLRGTRTGVFVGLSATEYGYLTMTDLSSIDAWSGTGAAASVIANRLSYLLDLRGPSLAVDTACSSSLVAVHQAVQSLQRGESSTALVAGVNLLLSPGITTNFHRAGVLAADGRCKAFDAAADGIVRGEGCGVVVLKTLKQARRSGDRVLAVIRGSAVNSDGRSNGLMAPNPEAQAMLLRDAYSVAGVDPSAVDYVEAHGTGTLLGDPIEAGALGEVLGASRDNGRPLLIGSVKSNLGHLEGAAGIAGLIKVVLSLVHRRLPPSLHFTSPNPHIDFDALALRVVAEGTGWPRYSGMAVAGVSAFGFGGTNAHVVLEEWPAAAPARRETGDGPRIFALSARSADGLAARATALAGWAESADAEAVSLDAVADTLARRREHLPVRAAVLAEDRAGLAERLRELGRGHGGPGIVTGEAHDTKENAGGPVFVFSGYGSQWAGMGRELLAGEPAFAAGVDALDPVFRAEAGFSLRSALAGELEPPDLAATQLVLFGMQVALAGLWRAHGVEPAAVLGHSMGEVAAAVTAGALDVAAGLRVMTTRARLLAGIDASGTGAMAVVELSQAELAELEDDFPDITVAVYASPSQCTVSGDADQVTALVGHVENLGRLAKLLPVGGAGHSPAVDAVLGRFREELADLAPAEPVIPCYTSVLDDPRERPSFDVGYWAANLRRPVRFTQALAAALGDGHRTFIEISPHPVAVAAIEQTAGGDAVVLPSSSRKHGDRFTFLAGLAKLHVLGHPGVLAAVPAGRSLVELPAPPWRHRSFWPSRPAGAGSRGGGHPLLGAHVELPEGDRHVWRGEVGTERHPWLADHAAMGVPLFPATGYLELALAAASAVLPAGDGQLRVADLELHRVLPLSAGTEVTTSLSLKTSLNRNTEDTVGTVSVHAKSDRGKWACHATAEIRTGHRELSPFGEVAEQAPGARVFDLYGALDAMGQSYGPAFRGLRGVVAVPGRASASIALPPQARADSGYALHPALADACLHALAAAAGEELEQGAGVYLPLALGEVTVHGDPGLGVRVDAVLDSVGESRADLLGAVQLVDADGAVLVEFGQVYARRFQRSALPVPLADKVFEARWERAGQFGEPADTGDRGWLVLSDAAGPRVEALRAELTGVGEVHTAGVTDRAALAELLRSRRSVTDVVLMAGADEVRTAGFAAPEQVERLVLAVAGVVAELAELVDPPRLWLACSGDGGGLGCLRGLVRVLAFEHPELRASLVDFGEDLARLRDELLAGSPEDEVAWRDGVRHVRRLAHPGVAEPGRDFAVRAGAYLITGGLGGLGLVAARWLAERGASRLVLSGRRGAGPDTEPALAALRELGAEVAVVAGDIAEPGTAERLVSVATAGGLPLRGVLHAAGVLADGAAISLAEDALAAVWRPKALGAWRLHEATAGHELDWWLVYSSAAALFGSPGQAAYATANAWVDELVTWRRANGLPGTTIQWGAWGEAGAAAGSANPVLDPLGSAEALEALEVVLGQDRVATGVARLDSRTVLALFPQLAARPFFELLTPAGEPAAVPETVADQDWAGMAALRAGDPAEARAGLAERLAAIVAGLMGFSPDQVDRHRPLTELGLDSLLAMRARSAVERDFGLPLPVPLLLRGASLADVAGHLADQAGFAAGPPEDDRPAVIGPRDPAERWVARKWQEVLDGDEGNGLPGVHDDFFAAGGDPARADRLRAAFAGELGAVPEAEALFAVPTIAVMADLLRAEIEGHRQAGAGPVRVLREGGTDPVFLFHPAGGPTSVYQELVRRLGGGRPVYGFERLDTVDTVEEKAAHYAELVRQLQPAGPYRLGGWSFGGCLAYETARQLTAAGERVDLVFMIDSILPLAAGERSPEQLLLDRFGRFAEHIEQTYGIKLDLPAGELARLPEHDQIKLVIDHLAEVPGMGQAVLHHQYTSYLDARVAERYQPEPYDGHVLLFRAQDPHPLTTSLDPRYLRTDDALGWDEHCARLEIVRVPGDHLSMIDPPNVSVIADALDPALMPEKEASRHDR